jgi:hypothetical protein
VLAFCDSRFGSTYVDGKLDQTSHFVIFVSSFGSTYVDGKRELLEGVLNNTPVSVLVDGKPIATKT